MLQKEIWNIGGAFQSPAYLIELSNFLKEMNMHHIRLNVFDSHYNLIWNGGNAILSKPRKKELFVKLVKAYNTHGIGFNLVFSNLYVQKEHLNDPRCNYILEECHSSENGVIVTSHVLAEYIKENYPKYKLIHSLTHVNEDVYYYLNLKDLYDVFVMPPNLNYSEEKLMKLKDMLGGERLEILVNDTCYRGCPFQRKHYELSSRAMIEENWDLMEELWDSFCKKHHEKRINEAIKAKNLLDIQTSEFQSSEIDNLRAKGFCNFKLATRDVSLNSFTGAIETYILDRYHLKKPFNIYTKYFPKTHKAYSQVD